jgi:hypothetical protein
VICTVSSGFLPDLGRFPPLGTSPGYLFRIRAGNTLFSYEKQLALSYKEAQSGLLMKKQVNIQIQEDNGSFYVVVNGQQWARSTSNPKAEEIAESLKLAAGDPEIEIVK